MTVETGTAISVSDRFCRIFYMQSAPHPFFLLGLNLCLDYICHGRRAIYLSTIFLTVFRHRGNDCGLRRMCLH